MKKQHLINKTYQVINNNNDVLFQGTEMECEEYIMLKSIENFVEKYLKN